MSTYTYTPMTYVRTSDTSSSPENYANGQPISSTLKRGKLSLSQNNGHIQHDIRFELPSSSWAFSLSDVNALIFSKDRRDIYHSLPAFEDALITPI